MKDVASQPTGVATGRPALSFSLFGFPVRVRVEFAIVAALLGSTGDGTAEQIAAWVGVVFVSVLFHELGHAVVARRVGYRPWIELYGMGGLTHCARIETTPPASWRTDLAIALAGPAFGLALGAGVWVARLHVPLLSSEPLAQEIVRDLLWANIGWSVLNLVPILPYDGGLAALAILGRLFPQRGVRLAYQLTAVVASLALAASIYTRWLWTGYLAARALMGALRVLRFDAALRRGWERWDAFRFAEARAEAERAAARAPDPFARARALELLVFALLADRNAAGAKAAYDALVRGGPPSALLRAIVALDTGEHAEAKALLQAIPPAFTARVVLPMLIAWATSGWEDRATAWLDSDAFAALPSAVLGDLAEALRRRDCRGLSARVDALRQAGTAGADLSSRASP